MTATLPRTATESARNPVASAAGTLDIEAQGLAALSAALRTDMAAPFEAAVELLRGITGRLIVTGMGKSGHVGQKIAATLASTGTPSFFVHPSEASHGDLGMIMREDAILACSWSGETVELSPIITYAKRFGVPIIAITSNTLSALGKAANVVLILPQVKEACPHGLAPTTSTLMQLALGDCLAVALLEAKGFTAFDFKVFHPGGQLGAALSFVADIMHGEARLPLAGMSTPMAEAIVTMTEKSLGCLGVVDESGRLAGIITDGDLRRHMGSGLLDKTTGQIMTRGPKTIAPDELAATALEMCNAATITALFVVEQGRPVGIVHIHDLLRLGVA